MHYDVPELDETFKVDSKKRPDPPFIVAANSKPPHDPREPEPKRVYNPITEKKVEEMRKIRINNAYVRAQAQSKVAGELAVLLKEREDAIAAAEAARLAAEKAAKEAAEAAAAKAAALKNETSTAPPAAKATTVPAQNATK